MFDNPNQKGALAEIAFAKAAVEAGCGILLPATEHGRYDMAIEFESRLYRVQCKWGSVRGSVVFASLRTTRYKPNGQRITTSYSVDEIDAFGIYAGTIDQCFLLPVADFAGMRGVHLRLEPPRNHQKVGINAADQYRMPGAVAQMARATRWQRVGRGFESRQLHPGSASLTSRGPGSEAVPAGELDTRLARYLQRAGRGEQFTVTRRGTPVATLGPPQPQLPDIASPDPPSLTRPPPETTP